MEEYIQVVNEQRVPIGVETRTVIHEKGYWHETFQCWIAKKVENEVYVYLQLRSRKKKDFPHLYDISAAGHILADEIIEDGIRELKEEIGLEVAVNDLKKIGIISNEMELSNFKDREFCHVYLYIEEEPLYFSFEDDEVEEMILVKLQDLQAMLLTNQEKEIDIYDLSMMKQTKRLIKTLVVPHEKQYFDKVFQGIIKYMD
jgi:isopentenyldiphosphate isomerase